MCICMLKVVLQIWSGLVAIAHVLHDNNLACVCQALPVHNICVLMEAALNSVVYSVFEVSQVSV